MRKELYLENELSFGEEYSEFIRTLINQNCYANE